MLKRLFVKIAVTYRVLPTKFVLAGAKRIHREPLASGAFADVYCGTYRGSRVALKHIRLFSTESKSKRKSLEKVSHRRGRLQ